MYYKQLTGDKRYHIPVMNKAGYIQESTAFLLDNPVHIARKVEVGENGSLVGCVAVTGSTKLEQIVSLGEWQKT